MRLRVCARAESHKVRTESRKSVGSNGVELLPALCEENFHASSSHGRAGGARVESLYRRGGRNPIRGRDADSVVAKEEL